MKNENNEKESQFKSTKRQRSPNFPSISLEDAIARVKVIYQHDKRAFTTVEAIISHLGYKRANARSGSAGRAVASLKHYGLLDEKTGQLRVSDNGFKILHLPEDSEERRDLIKEAALAPAMFKKIYSNYEGELPSDTTLKSYLILSEKFNPESVSTFIRALRETIRFANPSLDEEKENAEDSEKVSDNSDESSTGKRPSASTISASLTPPATQQSLTSTLFDSDSESLKFRISRDSEVVVTFSGRVTQEAIEKLRTLLDATKDTYPTQAELEQPRSAVWRNKDHDQPVKVVSELGQGSDGRNYVKIEGSETGVPIDELNFGEN